MKRLLFCAALIPLTATAEECRLGYWEVLSPSRVCDSYVLPDFTLARSAAAESDSDVFKRYCTPYEVRSSVGTQRVAYCYTGEGPPAGPIFKVGEKEFVANFNFEGCRGKLPVSGIVFHPSYGSTAAKNPPLRPFQRENFKDPIRCP